MLKAIPNKHGYDAVGMEVNMQFIERWYFWENRMGNKEHPQNFTSKELAEKYRVENDVHRKYELKNSVMCIAETEEDANNFSEIKTAFESVKDMSMTPSIFETLPNETKEKLRNII